MPVALLARTVLCTKRLPITSTERGQGSELAGVSGGRPPQRPRTVILNWRDSRHPQAGGAELYAESVARRLVRDGHEVTLLSAAVAGAPRDEVVDGVKLRRRGGRFGVYLQALLWLRTHRHDIDGVIDFQNGIPFFSPLALPRTKPIVCVVFHVHQEQFNVYFRWPLNKIGRVLEGPVSRWVYGRRSLVVISPSTRSDVRRKLRLKGPVYVIPCGMDTPVAAVDGVLRRSPEPRIACVGRLVPHKRMDLLIASLPEVTAVIPDLRVDIMGTGSAEDDLKQQVDALGLSQTVTFHGRVSDAARDQMLSQAWLTVNPSAGEGWGLSVLEANACGVPAIAFRVPGLQDAIIDGETGWLVDKNGSLALTILDAFQALRTPRGALKWREASISWARQFNWDWTTLRIDALLRHEGDRLSRKDSERDDSRAPTDLACRVDLPASAETLQAIRLMCRRTDVWRRHDGRITALLHGADEDGVRAALRRAGVSDEADIRPARTADWLLGGVPPEHSHA